VTPSFQPLPVAKRPHPFSHPDWFFEIKWDGFRALLYLDHKRCRLVSRNGNEFKSFPVLNASLSFELKVESAVLDGEIVCLNKHGKPQFTDLLFRRGEPRFCAFDLLWCEGEDLRLFPLNERKQRLRSVMMPSNRLLYCDHIEEHGEKLFHLACAKDLEGIVAKRKFDPYTERTQWLKIRNKNYSQWVGREKLFERERSEPQEWDSCALACADVA
jgi:ATP-dependent DNA ligase